MQIQSAINAFIPFASAETKPINFAIKFERGDYISPSMTNDQKEEFKHILMDGLGPIDDYIKQQIESLDEWLDNKESRASLFDIFIEYFCEVTHLLKIHSGVLECNGVFATAILKTHSMYDKVLQENNKKLHRMICLLMGSAYNREIPEWELIEKYKYPALSKQDMLTMYNEDW